MEALALDLDAVLGDTRPLWRAWLEDLRRRARVDIELPEDRAAAASVLDGVVGNWRVLLERFAEEHAALRRLGGAGVRLGAFTDAPEPLARVAAAQLGVARRLEALESGPDALERLLEQLGPGTRIVRSTADLAG